MRYMRCKCGKRECWTSMGHADCDGCERCNTTLEEHPDYHRAPGPHRWGEPQWKIDPATGERWQERRCSACYKKERVASAPSPEERADG